MSELERSLPPLATLVAFEAAYRHHNFSRAAAELFQSPTTVSRRVRELEDDLGLCLFERQRHDVAPTSDADELVASVRLSLNELAATAERLRRRAADEESLTVLASLSLTSVLVVPALEQLQHRYRDLNVQVISACEPIDSTRHPFDVALQYGTGESARFDVEFITNESVFPVCSPSVAERLPDPVTVEALSTMPLLHVDYADSTWTTWPPFLTAFGADGPFDQRSLVFSSYATCLDVAERGEGIALGWEFSVGPRISSRALVRVPGLTLAHAGRINAYLPDEGPGRGYASEFVSLVRSHLSNTASPEDAGAISTEPPTQSPDEGSSMRSPRASARRAPQS